MDYSVNQGLLEGYDSNDKGNADESQFLYVTNAILSGTARLNVLLPTALTIFPPLLTDDGVYTTLNRWLRGFFVALCAASCIYFTFTDSFKTASGGIALRSGNLQRGLDFQSCKKEAFCSLGLRLRWSDSFHAVLSLIAFLVFAGCHSDVVGCYCPLLPRNVTNTLTLVVGFVVSVLLVVFPSKRRGIGDPFLLHKDALS